MQSMQKKWKRSYLKFKITPFLAGALGIEPSSAVLETVILPMYDAPSQEQLIVYMMKVRMSMRFYTITIFSVSSN